MKHNEEKTLEFQLLDTARSHLVNICLITLLITGFAVLPIQIGRIIDSGLNPVSLNHFFILGIGAPIILLRKKFSLLFRTVTLLGISLSSSYFGLFSFGIVGSGFFGMGLVGCTVAALVIGKWLGFTLLALSSFIFLGFTYYLFHSETSIIIPVLQRYVSTKGAWYNALSGFVLPVFMLIMGIDEMHKILREYIKKIDISGKELDRENRFRAALFNTTDSFVLITDSNGNITDMNSACEKSTGLSLNDVKGKSFIEIFLTESTNFSFEELFNISDKKRYEEKWNNKIGHPHLVNFTLNPIYFEQNGEITHWFISGVDMTEYRELEKKFIQAQKMESIGKLAGGVAHDFNNFLTGIIGSAEMLKLTTSSENNADNNEYLDTILTAGNKASSLVKQLLNFSRLESGPTEIINVETIIDDALALLKRSIKQHIHLEKQISDRDIFIRGENAQIVNALLNLGINARDAIETEGKITISARKIHLKPSDFPEDEISYGFFVRIDVNDTGSGIPKHLIDKIFDPFFTTKEEGKGTGLGLSSVYGTVKRHKGIIKVYSELGIGTTFSLFIPLTEVDPKYPKKVMNSIIKNMKPCNILLVDDEEVIRKNTAKLLKDFSHSVITAENGLDALTIIRNTDNKFDIVILDWIMPKMNGDETLRIIRSLFPDLKVLVSSGFGTDKKLLESAAAYSKVFFIAKPYTPEEMLEVISEMQNTP